MSVSHNNIDSKANIVQRLKRDLASNAHMACSRGLTASGLGVLGVRTSDNDSILVTPAGMSFKDIRPNDICKIHLTGDILEMPAGLKPPSETTLYLKVFQDRPDVNALAHLYPPNACGYAEQNQLFPIPKDRDRQQLRELIKVECRECPSRYTGLCSCRTDIRQSYIGADALLLKENGIITLAADLSAVLDKTEFLENAAKSSSLSAL